MEKDLEVNSIHQGNEESKASSSEKSLKNNKGISKTDSKNKDKESTYMEIMHRIIKKITNEIIDLNKNKGEGMKPFKAFLKKKIDSTP